MALGVFLVKLTKGGPWAAQSHYRSTEVSRWLWQPCTSHTLMKRVNLMLCLAKLVSDLHELSRLNCCVCVQANIYSQNLWASMWKVFLFLVIRLWRLNLRSSFPKTSGNDWGEKKKKKTTKKAAEYQPLFWQRAGSKNFWHARTLTQTGVIF